MVILVLVVAAIVLGVGIAFLVSYSTKEISDTLGMPAVTVRSHLHRARRHFPAAMNPDRQKEDCIRLVLEVSRRDLRAVRLAELYLVLHGDAPFYILDEPFTQVDPVNIEDVKSMIRERANDHGVIITDHNYDAISSVADNLFVISTGLHLGIV